MQTEQDINSGKLSILKPRKALNKAFLKVKPSVPIVVIDRLVYELYGLTEEEIGIVEGSIN